MAITPQTHGTGLVPQPVDKRDFQMADVLPGLGTPALALPPTGNTSKWSVRRDDQSNTNRCTAFAALKAAAIQRARQGLAYIDPCFDWTYYHTRARDSVIAGTHGVVSGDGGGTGRQAMLSLKTDGYLGVSHKRADGLWVGWPNGVQTMNIDPEAWWHQTVQPWSKPPYKVLNLYECDEDPQISAHHHKAITVRAVASTALAVKGSIHAGFAVTGGIPARQSLYDVGQSGIMTIPTEAEQLYGYHDITFVDYDDTMSVDGHTGFFRIENSWGPTWGASGFGWMPYAWFSDPTCCPFDCWAVHWSQ